MRTIALDELPALALFAQIVRLGSFTAAAREAGLAKSAVSKRVSRLEDQLGVRLLHRTTRRLSLTADGLRFYQHCEALVAAAQAAHDAVAGAGDVVRGMVRVNAPVAFAQRYLTRAIAAFLVDHVGVEVQLTADDRMVDVVEGGYDLAVRVGRLRDTSLVARRLATDRLVLCAAPTYLARAGTPAHPEQLIHHNCLRYGLIAAADEWRFRGPDGAYVVPTRGSFTASSGSLLREAVLAGLGVAVLPRHMVASDVAAGRLALVLEGHRRAEIGIHALYADRRLPARTRALLDHLAGWFAGADWTALAGDRG